ncbi:MAG: tetratricopeptide repeat protein [Verrucomicrobiota bacterium]
MRIRNLLVALCSAAICVAAVSSSFAQSDAEFAKANQLYSQGDYKQAIDNYLKLVRTGEWSPALFYDLGNAYFRAKDFGRAVLNYKRALALDRHHPESAANLRIARDETRALEMQPSWLTRHLQFVSLNQCSIAAAAAFWAGIFCIAGLVFARRRSTGAIMLSTLSFAFLAVALFAAYKIDNESKGLGIVTGKDVTARLATADNASTVLVLPAGSEIKILSIRGDWTYAALPNDQRGWIRSKDAESVRL